MQRPTGPWRCRCVLLTRWGPQPARRTSVNTCSGRRSNRPVGGRRGEHRFITREDPDDLPLLTGSHADPHPMPRILHRRHPAERQGAAVQQSEPGPSGCPRDVVAPLVGPDLGVGRRGRRADRLPELLRELVGSGGIVVPQHGRGDVADPAPAHAASASRRARHQAGALAGEGRDELGARREVRRRKRSMSMPRRRVGGPASRRSAAASQTLLAAGVAGQQNVSRRGGQPQETNVS